MQSAQIQENGFSALEMVMVLLITFVLASQSIPTLVEWQQSFQRAAAKDTFEYDVLRAKSEALSSGAIAIIEVIAGGGAYQLGIDRFPYENPPLMDEVLFSRTLPEDISITTSDTIRFDSRGLLVDEFGAPTTMTANLMQNTTPLPTAHIYAIGRVCFGDTCNEL